jgi:hypothetical protein
MKRIIRKHKSIWKRKAFVSAVFLGILMFGSSLLINYWANNYAVEVSSNTVTDMLLDNLPFINTAIVFVEGSLAFVALIIILTIHEPKIIPFVLKSTALFVFVRSIFVSLTHLGSPLHQAVVNSSSDIFNTLIYSAGADYFFSGHTGLPFLFALIFWRQYYLRVIFLLSSLAAGISVLLGRMHYSIDVMAAFFITYSIYQIARWLFKKDYSLFLSEENGSIEAVK